MEFTQSERFLSVKTPLETDELLVHSFAAAFELGRTTGATLKLLSESGTIAADDLLGEDMTVSMKLQDGDTRYYHGYVMSFAHEDERGQDLFTYRVGLMPWFAFLRQTTDCRIFQEMSVPDVIDDVFTKYGFSDFRFQLNNNHPIWEYCVQYRETAHDFLCRLMEREGMYYFFEYEDGKHTMVICDSEGSHDVYPGADTFLYYAPSENVIREEEHIFDWRVTHRFKPVTYSTDDYNFKTPSTDLFASSTMSADYTRAEYEIYDYPGAYYIQGDITDYADVHAERLQTDKERAEAQCTLRNVHVGSLFSLDLYPRDDQNREYLIVSSKISAINEEYRTAGAEGGRDFSCSFVCMPSNRVFRPERVTPLPEISGPQTAKIVGPSGDEIYTDAHGRVKCEFHWDRYSNTDETSSCWIRVSSPWAGGNWGAIQIPRIGQEVIVEFIEGDPDRPIVTGRVYNEEQKPPYELPANKTQSGVKSRSSKEGTAANFNEIRFEDKKGEEEMYIHAEKNQNTVVENDQTITVGFEDADPGDRALAVNNDEAISIGRDRSKEVGRDKFETVKRNKKIDIGVGHNESIGSSMTIMVGSNLTETVGVNYSETVGAAMELTVGAAMAVSVGAVLTESVGASRSESVGGSKSSSIGANLNETIGSEHKLQVGKDAETDVGGKSKTSVKKDYVLQADKIQLVAKKEISLKTGSAQITMKKNGDITVKGKKINIKGSGDVVVKGSKIKEN